MTNNNETNSSTLKGTNLSVNDMNSSVNVRNSSVNGVNSSFIIGNINTAAKSKKIIKYLSIMTHKKNDVTGVITHFLDFSDSEKQGFTSHHDKRYHGRTTKHSAANPSRHSLGIFVPKTYLVNTQKVTAGMNKLFLRFKRYAYDIGHSIVSYDGMSELNKIPPWGNKFRRLNAVVVIPFIPFFKNTTTHTKHSGGHQHA